VNCNTGYRHKRNNCFIYAGNLLVEMDFIHPLKAVIPGVQGRILAVLAQTTADLNLRTIASIADVSEAQASRVLPGLVAIGLVERREAPPSALFRLVRDHIAAEPILALSRSRDRMIQKMREIAEGLPISPTSVIIFGSFARGEADAESDIDTLMIRPSGVSESDDAWSASVQQWIDRVGEVSGNRVEVLEVDEDEVPARLRSGRSVWQDIERDGLIIHGRSVDSFKSVSRG
jgi:predicted nucleotidyltransferase